MSMLKVIMGNSLGQGNFCLQGKSLAYPVFQTQTKICQGSKQRCMDCCVTKIIEGYVAYVVGLNDISPVKTNAVGLLSL